MPSIAAMAGCGCSIRRADYLAFARVLAAGFERYLVELLTYSIMPNHWHLVVRPNTNEALGRWLGWVGVTHVRRHHEHYHSRGGGHLYQGRFKSFPVSSDEHFLTLCRYVEANARRAKLVARAEEWPWCGLWHRQHRAARLPLAKWPVSRPVDWLRRVNRNLRDDALAQLRECVQRGRPLGDPDWVQATAKRLHLDFTLRGPGRPRKNNQ
jgi:putative transposase